MSMKPHQIVGLAMALVGTALMVLSYPIAATMQGASAILMVFIYGFLPFIGFILLTVGVYRLGRKSRRG